MQRAVIEKTILDSLIRAKLASLPDCNDVEAMPIAWSVPEGSSCNWTIPGWTGDRHRIARCAGRIDHYLSFLRAQFDIPDEGSTSRRKQGD